MIVNKNFKSLKGKIEYEVIYDCEYEDDVIFEYSGFNNLKGLLRKLSKEHIDSLYDEYDGASEIKVVGVTFDLKEDETNLNLSVFEDEVNANVVTKINNDDIDNRLLLNIKAMKNIIDNTLEQYPIKY